MSSNLWLTADLSDLDHEPCEQCDGTGDCPCGGSSDDCPICGGDGVCGPCAGTGIENGRLLDGDGGPVEDAGLNQ